MGAVWTFLARLLRWALGTARSWLWPSKATHRGQRLTALPPLLFYVRALDVADNRLGPSLALRPRDLVCLSRLTSLDLSRNGLKALPPALGSCVSLTSLNLAFNSLESLPSEIGTLCLLRTLGLKSNALRSLPPEIGDCASLVCLYLTDNRLAQLPDSLGRLQRLQKLQAASNALTSLPDALADCASLELLRCPRNALSSLPPRLGRAPRLAWLSFAGNPLLLASSPPSSSKQRVVPLVSEEELALGSASLGETGTGSVGVTAAEWRRPSAAEATNGATTRRVAYKRFAATVSPDGVPEDELASAAAVGCDCVPTILGCVRKPHAPHGSLVGMVSTVARGSALASRPPHGECLRSAYPPPGFSLFTSAKKNGVFTDASAVEAARRARRAAACAASALASCHGAHVTHGDVYGHNLVVDRDTGGASLVDFGGAFFYSPSSSWDFERIEARALGVLLSELAAVGGGDEALARVADRCLVPTVADRPRFARVVEELTALAGEA